MKEREKQLDLFDKTLLRTVEAGDAVVGIIKETIINVNRLQRLKKGEYYAKS